MSTLCVGHDWNAWAEVMTTTRFPSTHHLSHDDQYNSEPGVMSGEYHMVTRHAVDDAWQRAIQVPNPPQDVKMSFQPLYRGNMAPGAPVAASLRQEHTTRGTELSRMLRTTQQTRPHVVPDYSYVPLRGGASIYDAGAPVGPYVAQTCESPDLRRMHRRRAAGASMYDAGAPTSLRTTQDESYNARWHRPAVVPDHSFQPRNGGASATDAGAPTCMDVDECGDTPMKAHSSGANQYDAGEGFHLDGSAGQFVPRNGGASVFDVGCPATYDELQADVVMGDINAATSREDARRLQGASAYDAGEGY